MTASARMAAGMSDDQERTLVTDEPYVCPECGVEDAEYSVHERDCPSGFPTLAETGE